MSMHGKICVVTGGAGFIGSHVADALAAEGATVRVVDDLSTGKKENLTEVLPHIEFFEGSIADAALLKKVFDGADFVFHQAAIPSVPKSVKDPLGTHYANVDGTLAVFLAARDAGVSRVVYVSSSSVYGDSPTLPKQEDMPIRPLSPYAAHKAMGEFYGRLFSELYGLETVGLRYFNVFGPRQDPSSVYSGVISRFTMLIKAGEAPTIFGDGETSRDFTYIANVVDANLKAAKAPKEKVTGKVINIASGTATSLNELLAELNGLLGTDITPKYEDFREGDIKHSLADISRAKDLLGFSPVVSFTEGLEKTVS